MHKYESRKYYNYGIGGCTVIIIHHPLAVERRGQLLVDPLLTKALRRRQFISPSAQCFPFLTCMIDIHHRQLACFDTAHHIVQIGNFHI